MIDSLFLKIVNMSITGSFAIAFVMIARLLLNKAPKVFTYSLWGVVLFRLVCPFSIESMLSIIPVNKTSIPEGIFYAGTPQINTGVESVDNVINAYLPVGTPHASVNPIQAWTFMGELVWIAGIFAILAYGLVSFLSLKKRLENSVEESGNIYVSEEIDTPFVLGILSPRIYLPAAIRGEEREYILIHEKTHIKRFDHIAKILSFLVLCVHWFNPLVWAAFFLSGKDMEMSCDEKVIKSLGDGVKREYSYSLLSLATGKRILGATPLAFGEGDTRGRVKNVLNYKRPSFWVVAAAVLICFAAAAMLMTDQKASVKAAEYDDEKEKIEISTDNGTVDAVLAEQIDAAISKAIIEQNAKWHSGFATESHVVLGMEAGGNEGEGSGFTLTVFAMAMDMEFEYSDGWFEDTTGSHMPVAISFDVNEEGEYALNEYWMPMDGSGYGPSIKEKFPSHLYDDAIDTQKHVYGQIMNCYDDAIRHGELGKADVANRIEELLETIMSSPSESSRPGDYIDEHRIEYREIVYIGRHALDYCFSEFEKGGQTGLKGHIMAAACRDIMKVYGEEFNGLFNTGQDWYDAYSALVSKEQE